MPALASIMRDEWDSRLTCFGEFAAGDAVCLKSCALNLSCAIAKTRFLDFPALDDADFLSNRFDVFEAE